MKKSRQNESLHPCHGNGPLMLELEPRLLLSADLAGPLADQLVDDVLTNAHVSPVRLTAAEDGYQAVEASRSIPLELVVIDAATPDYQQLVADLLAERNDGRLFEVAVLDGSRDGVDQLSELLAERSDVSALHIISHGRDGSVSLGNNSLDLDELTVRAGQIQSWANALTAEADILVYGCNLAAGEEGRAFVSTLGRLTDADVAASDDRTGVAGLGGDWDLEYSIGDVQATVAVSQELQESWTEVLAVATGDVSTGTGNGSSLNFTHDVAGTDRLLLVSVSMANTGGSSVSSVTYDGQALSFVGAQQGGGNDVRVEIWSLVAPNTGTSNLVVNLSSSSSDGFAVGAMTFTGVDQLLPLGSFVGDGGVGVSNASVNVASATDGMVFSTLGVQSGANRSLTTGDTEQWDLHLDAINAGGSTAAGASSVTMDWDWGNNDEWAIGAVAINAASELAGHWTLDDGSGTTATDSSGNGNDGTLNNMDPGSDWVPGAVSGGLDFDGSNDYVDLGSGASIDDIFAGGGTVSAWINANGYGENDFGRVIDKSNDTSATSGWSFQIEGGGDNRLRFETGFSGGQGGWVTPDNSITLNGWIHVAAVYDSNSSSNDPVLYINGVAQATTQVQGPSGSYNSDAGYDARIGNFAGGTNRTFDGTIDDVRLYGRGLSAGDIAVLAGSSGGAGNSLWLSTNGSASGGSGLSSWEDHEVVRFSGPGLTFDPVTGTTDGNFTQVFDIENFTDDTDVTAVHYVNRDLQVGTNNFQLFKGDVLASLDSGETLTSTNSLSVNDEDVFVFRPDTPGDYSSGTFLMFFDGGDVSQNRIHGFTLVEQQTTVGGITLDVGDVLFSKWVDESSSNADIFRFVPGTYGSSTSGSTSTLIDGSDINLNFDDESQEFISGIALIEENMTIGDQTLTAGQLLVSISRDDSSVGDNSISVDENDVFILDVTTAGTSTVANATLLFDGSDVGLSSSSEDVDALALFLLSNSPPVITSDGGGPTAAINVDENTTAVTTVTYTDVDVPADTITYSLSGDDAALFSIDGSGNLSFISAPNFEEPGDFDLDGVYQVTVTVNDNNGGTDTQGISVTVNDVLELVVTNTNATGTGSLHEAIINANNNVGVTDTITFNIGGGGHQTILVDPAGLPTITDSVILDATTQPGYSGTPLITLDGSAIPGGSGINGILIHASDSTVKGFIVINMPDEGIEIDGTSGFGDNNTIQGNWVGVDKDGNIAGNTEYGIMVTDDANGNQIGGTGPNEGNVVAGNGFAGIVIREDSDNNVVEGNIIGLEADGMTVASNGHHGILISQSADNNRIGGSAAGAGNVISANTQDGIYIDGTTDPTYTTSVTGTVIQGNYIGTDATGNTQAGNDIQGTGITIFESDGNTVGGSGAGEANVLSGNRLRGLYIFGSTATDNTVSGNFIGTTADGSAALTNVGPGQQVGVYLFDAPDNTLGGTTAGAGNVISGNITYGIYVWGASTSGNRIQGNTVGLDATRTSAIGNGNAGGAGIYLTTAPDNLIGGTAAGAGNVIAGNPGSGIEIVGASATGNKLLSNLIYDNGGMGIDLGDDGVTNNDPDDTDPGANDLQNYPVITGAYLDGTDLLVDGTFDADGSVVQYRIEFYGNASGTEDLTHGEGRIYLGSTTVTTNASGDATFTDVTLSGVTLAAGDSITATATRITDPGQVGLNELLAYGSSSEFAANHVIIDNYAPVITSDGGGPAAALNVPENATAVTTVTCIDADVPPDTITYVLSGDDAALFQIDGSGNLSFIAAPDFETPADFDADGVYEVTVTVDDNAGGTDSQDISVTVTDRNDAPVANADAYSVDENAVLTIANGSGELTANDTDQDSDPLTVNTSPVTGPANGSLNLFADGSFTYTPDPDFNGTDTFTYEILDGQGGNAQAVVMIAVNAVNSDPVVIGENFVVAEDGSIIGGTGVPGLLANDSDTEGDSLSVNSTPVSGPDNGILVLNTDGTFTYSPDENFNGSDGFVYEVSDGNGGIVQGAVTITVTPVNDAPVATDENFVIENVQALSFSVDSLLANDTDIEGEQLTVVAFTQPLNGAFVDAGNGTFIYTPAEGFEGIDSFTYTVEDESGAQSTATVIVNVLADSDTDTDPEPTDTDDEARDSEPEQTSEPVPEQAEVPADEPIAEIVELVTFGGSGTAPENLSERTLTSELRASSAPQASPFQQADNDRREQSDRDDFSLTGFGGFDFNGYTFQNVNLDHNALWQALDTMKREMERAENSSETSVYIPVISGGGIALTAGVISWILRGGALSAALLSTMPMWKGFDPLPLLAARRSDDTKKRHDAEDTASQGRPYDGNSVNVENIFSQGNMTNDPRGRRK